MTTDIETALAASATLAPWLNGTPAGRLWVGYSGGMDSTVLLHALRAVPRVTAIHIDHGLQPASASWAKACAEQALTFGVAFEMSAVRVGEGNRPSAARRARYDAWRNLLGPGEVLVLAHHGDDQAETRIWQILTGRAPGGMPTERALGTGRIVRPLLGLRRSALAAYAERFSLGWIEDPSNADTRFDRGYIRHRLLPFIESAYPGAMDALAAPRATAAVDPLPVESADAKRVGAWLLTAGLPCRQATLAELVRQSAAGGSRNPQVRIAPGISAWRYQGHWHLVEDPSPKPAPDWATVGEDQHAPAGDLLWRPGTPGLPSGVRLHWRQRRSGARLRVAGRGVGKAAKALFQEHAIPPWQRPQWPFLYDEDDRLVAVAGLAMATHAAVEGGWQPHWQPRPAPWHGGE